MNKYEEIYVQPKWFSDAAPVSPKPASATLSISGDVADKETVTIGEEVYEFVEAASEDPETIEVVIEAASVAKKTAAEKLAEVINDNSEIVSAKAVTADANETVVVAYKDVGTDGNSIAVDKSCTNASWGADVVKLSGGKFGTPCPMKGLAVCIPDSSTPPVDIYYLCTNAGGGSTVEWKKFVLVDVDAV